MPAAPSQPSPLTAAPAPTAPVGPNPPLRRFWLLLKLLVVPVALVCLPSLFVTLFFGQRPEPKAPPDAAFTALRESLERAAREKLPEGAPTFGTRFEDLSLVCAASETDARLETLRELAARGGGTLTDQAADATGRHALVELPEENLARFRQEAAGAPAPVGPAPGPGSAARVFLRLTLAPAPTAAATP